MMKRIKKHNLKPPCKIIIFTALFFIVSLIFNRNFIVHASETEKLNSSYEINDSNDSISGEFEDKLINSIDFTEIEDSIDEALDNNDTDFKSLFMKIINGEQDFNIEYIVGYIGEILYDGIKQNKSALVQIILLVSIAALLSNLTDIFGSAHLNEISFYIIYLILITLLIKAFYVITGMVSDTLQNLLNFMEALIPSFFGVITFTTGASSSAFFYQIIMIAIYAVEWFLLQFVLPVINIYVVLVLINNISKTDFLSKMTELMQSFVDWLLKFLMGAVISINILQGLIAPVLDSMKRGILTKAATAIPGVGNAINSVTKIILGSGILIKNGVGIAAMIIILAICLIPYIKMLIITVGYKIIAAVIQPIGDKRMIEGISGTAEAMRMLTKVVFTAGVLFLVTIALITAATSVTYM